METTSEVGSVATAIWPLTKTVELQQVVHGNRHENRQLVANLINQHVEAQVDVAAAPLASPQMLPVLYDKDIFQCHLFDTAL